MMAEYLAITYRCVVKFPVSNTCVASVATPIQQGPLVLFYRKEIPDDKTCAGQVLEPYENKRQIMPLDAMISRREELDLVCPDLYRLGWKL